MKELPLEISVDDVSHLLSQPDGKPRMVDCRERLHARVFDLRCDGDSCDYAARKQITGHLE